MNEIKKCCKNNHLELIVIKKRKEMFMDYNNDPI